MQKQISTHVILRIALCILASGLGYYISERETLQSLTGNSSSSNGTVRLFSGMQNPMNVKYLWTGDIECHLS